MKLPAFLFFSILFYVSADDICEISRKGETSHNLFNNHDQSMNFSSTCDTLLSSECGKNTYFVYLTASAKLKVIYKGEETIFEDGDVKIYPNLDVKVEEDMARIMLEGPLISNVCGACNATMLLRKGLEQFEKCPDMNAGKINILY